MDSEEQPGGVIAAIDAAFEQGPVPAPPLPEERPTVTVPTEPAASPLGDYVRELQQEFEEQEDEGKL